MLVLSCVSVVSGCASALPLTFVKGRGIVVISRLVYFLLAGIGFLYAIEYFPKSQPAVGVVNEDLVCAAIRAYRTLGVRVQN